MTSSSFEPDVMTTGIAGADRRSASKSLTTSIPPRWASRSTVPMPEAARRITLIASLRSRAQWTFTPRALRSMDTVFSIASSSSTTRTSSGSSPPRVSFASSARCACDCGSFDFGR